MGEIIKLCHKDQQNAHNFIKDLVADLENVDIDGVIVAIKTRNGDVLTGHFNLDVSDRLYLASHIQADVHFDIAGVE